MAGLKGRSGPIGNENSQKHGASSRRVMEELFAVPPGQEDLGEYLKDLQALLEAELGEMSERQRLFLSVLISKAKRWLILERYLNGQATPDPKGLENWLKLAGAIDRSLLVLGLEKKKLRDDIPEDERPLDSKGLAGFYRERGLL